MRCRFTTRWISVALLCLGLPQTALAQRIHDYSMSPEESLKQPDITSGNATSIYSTLHTQPYSGDSGSAIGSYASSPYDTQASHRFMDGYCDPQFKPLLADNPRIAGMQSCIAQQKQQACATFTQLPADAQQTLDSTISCLYRALNDDDEIHAKVDDCTDSDTRRLQLLKRYWQDQATAHALVFLPDEVMHSSNRCVGER